jgi:hypothetical protein
VPAQQGVEIGGGIRRIEGGSSPLFTNMPDDGLEGNNSLMNRRPMSAQNQGAMDNMQARQDAGDAARLQKFQYDQEVAQAAAINANTANQPASTGGFGLMDGGRLRERELRMAAESSQGATEGGRAYRIRLANAGAALNDFRKTQNAAPALAAEQRLGMQKLQADERASSARLGLDALKMGEDARTGAVNREATQVSTDKTRQLASLQSQYLAAPDDATRSKIAATLSALSGDKSSTKDNFMVVGGGQEYDERAGVMRNVPQTLIDLRTGQPVNGGGQAQKPATPTGPATPKTRAEYDALPPGARYMHSDGTIKIKAGQ